MMMTVDSLPESMQTYCCTPEFFSSQTLIAFRAGQHFALVEPPRTLVLVGFLVLS